MKTRAVIFVEKTPRVELARLVREQINGMGATLGFKLKVVERTGRKLVTNFPQTKICGGLQCGRDYCVTCNQGGEDLGNYITGIVVYESIPGDPN